MEAGPESSSAAASCRHISGLWLGEAVPDTAFATEVAVNPIKWSLSLVEGQGPVSVFGGGYFDDAGDIPGCPVLFFHLAGQWNVEAGTVEFDKIYDASKVPTDLKVAYKGKLSLDGEGQPFLSGKWENVAEGTYGVFGARLEEQQAKAPFDTFARRDAR